MTLILMMLHWPTNTHTQHHTAHLDFNIRVNAAMKILLKHSTLMYNYIQLQ